MAEQLRRVLSVLLSLRCLLLLLQLQLLKQRGRRRAGSLATAEMHSTQRTDGRGGGGKWTRKCKRSTERDRSK